MYYFETLFNSVPLSIIQETDKKKSDEFCSEHLLYFPVYKTHYFTLKMHLQNGCVLYNEDIGIFFLCVCIFCGTSDVCMMCIMLFLVHFI